MRCLHGNPLFQRPSTCACTNVAQLSYSWRCLIWGFQCIEKGLKTVKNTGQTVARRDEIDDSGLVLDSDSSRPCSEIDRDEHHSYSRSLNNDQLGPFKPNISSNQGQIYKPYSSQRDDRNSTVSYASTNSIPSTSYPSRFSPTSSATSFSRTSPSNQPQQLPRLNSLGIQKDLPNGLPGVAQMLLPSVSTHQQTFPAAVQVLVPCDLFLLNFFIISPFLFFFFPLLYFFSFCLIGGKLGEWERWEKEGGNGDPLVMAA